MEDVIARVSLGTVKAHMPMISFTQDACGPWVIIFTLDPTRQFNTTSNILTSAWIRWQLPQGPPRVPKCCKVHMISLGHRGGTCYSCIVASRMHEPPAYLWPVSILIRCLRIAVVAPFRLSLLPGDRKSFSEDLLLALIYHGFLLHSPLTGGRWPYLCC